MGGRGSGQIYRVLWLQGNNVKMFEEFVEVHAVFNSFSDTKNCSNFIYQEQI